MRYERDAGARRAYDRATNDRWMEANMTQQYSEETAVTKRAIYENWLLHDPGVPRNYLTTLNATYKDFKANGGLLVITVLPNRSEMAFFSQYFDPAKALSPLENNIGVGKQDVASFISYWPSSDEHWTAATQLTFSGGIYSVANVIDICDKRLDPTKQVRVNFRPFEDYIARSVRKYVDCLRDLTVDAPLFVGISLLGVKNYRLTLGEANGDCSSHENEICDNIQADMVEIPARARIAGLAAAVTVVKPAFRYIRRAFRTPPLYSYDPVRAGGSPPRSCVIL